jgi:uncharacterized protein
MYGKWFRVLSLLTFAAFSRSAAALEIPKLQGRVNDLAGLLSPDQTQNLDTKLKGLEATDSTQVAILIIPSLEGEALEDFSERVASSWRLGMKAQDNGALLLIAMKERKVRIEVGYGLEPTLTDALCRRIIENEILPNFRQGLYYQGIDDGITALIQAVRGVYQASGRSRTGARERNTDHGALNLIIFLLVPLLWILNATGKWGGGIFGAGAGLYLAFTLFGGSLLPILLGGIIGGVLGLFLGSLVRAGTRAASNWRGGGFTGPFYYGGRGGGASGGGFRGGGFSGGGGSFGGGGASGGW